MARRNPRPWHRRFAAQPKGVSGNLISTLSQLGLTSGLQLALDAGDPESYTSGQKWLDRSGNGYDFFLGADGNAGTSDPTYSTDGYFSFDGGDYFTYDTTNETWMNNLHKDNAALTILVFAYIGVASTQFICGTDQNADVGTPVGFDFRTTGGAVMRFAVTNGAGSALSVTGSTVSAGAWQLLGVSLDESIGASGGFLLLNSTATTFTSTYSSPSSASATYTMQLGAGGNAASPIQNGGRFGFVAMWNRSLSQTECASVYNAMRGRFGV